MVIFGFKIFSKLEIGLVYYVGKEYNGNFKRYNS